MLRIGRMCVERLCRHALAGALLALLCALPAGLSAQGAGGAGDAQAVAAELAPLSAEERAALIGRLTDAQARELLLHYLAETAPQSAQAGDAAAAVSTIELLRSRGTAIRHNLVAVLGRADDLFGEYGRVMEQKLGIDIGGGGLLLVIAYVLGLSLVGGLAEYLFRRLTRDALARNEAASAQTVRERLMRALVRLAHDLLAIAAFAAGYAAAFLAIWGGNAERRDFTVAVLVAILLTRVAVALVRFVFVPDQPAWRIMPADDEAAAHFVNGTRRQAVLGSTLLLICALGLMWGVEPDVWRLGALLAGILFTASVLTFLWRYRRHLLRAVEAAIKDGAMPRWAESAAGWGWYILAVNYVIVAFVVGVYDLLLDISFDPTRAVLGFFILFVANPYATALAIGLWAPEPEPGPAGAAAEAATAGAGSGAPDGTPDGAVEVAAELAPALIEDRRMLRRVISITVLVLSLAAFSVASGVNAFSAAGEHPLAQFLLRMLLDVGVVALAAYIAWAFSASWIDRKLAEEHARVPMPAADPSAGPSMQGGTRLQTILPIIRKTLAVTIILLATLVALDVLGVNILPLIAGAGVVGLAIGFGAQTLVKDVISGLFFLMDDAFRIGEYIEFGDVGGTVERFNPRSIVLRGYLGAVYTVPYGEIGSVTNYSRDWVIMKLRFRVPYDTDIDQVRRIFKKIGEELLADPELGPSFIQPFKSQGVVKMDDSAFIVSGKFMTKPNRQFAVRKAVYERVQRAFREHGIRFAPKRVIVDVPQTADLHEEEETPPTAIRAAAAAAVAAESRE